MSVFLFSVFYHHPINCIHRQGPITLLSKKREVQVAGANICQSQTNTTLVFILMTNQMTKMLEADESDTSSFKESGYMDT